MATNSFKRRTERYDSIDNWTAINPVLAGGEISIAEFNYNDRLFTKIKIGNGIDNWLTLPYVANDDNKIITISPSDWNTSDKTYTVTGTLLDLKKVNVSLAAMSSQAQKNAFKTADIWCDLTWATGARLVCEVIPTISIDIIVSGVFG